MPIRSPKGNRFINGKWYRATARYQTKTKAKAECKLAKRGGKLCQVKPLKVKGKTVFATYEH